jgi:uncharacterized protein
MSDVYDEVWLSDILRELRISSSAAHVHGSLVGYLSAGGQIQTQLTLDDEMNAEPIAVEDDIEESGAELAERFEDGNKNPKHWFAQLLDDEATDIPRETQIELDQFARFTASLLQQDDLRFELMLPEDARPIEDRVQSLNEWCGAYIGGLGLGGFAHIKELSKDARSALKHFEQIARTEVELDDDEEGNENALMELTEFAKVSVLMLYAEIALMQAKASANARPVVH